jgi:RND family efflux transporter MFP subunit
MKILTGDGKMSRILLTCLLTLPFLLMGCGEGGKAGHEENQTVTQKSEQYQCPMHPTYISDQEGECPICGMNLVPIEEEEEGMETQMEMGRATVRIKPEMQQLIGVKTEEARIRPLSKTIRTVGKVDYDETRLYHIHTKVTGWIEDLNVDYTGRLVHKGEKLLTIYSPELVSTQEEYLLALKARESLEKSPFEEIASGGETLREATKRRLILWDITDDQIRQLEKDGKVQTKMTLYSPVKGFVMKKFAQEGLFVSPGMHLYEIADLSTVWIYADIYEYEVPFIHEGQKARVSLPYSPGEVLEGKVTYVYPTLEPKTRTVKVRLEFPNPDGRLKPEMFTNVQIDAEMGSMLAIPEESVIDTGTRQVVFIDQGEGKFEPREVKLGVRVDRYYEVIEGLSERETVVTSANFLIDSESKLRAAIHKATEHQH